ncbi:hypothetical protein [Colwellia psychrerythraea]|uniref:Lipoprotein n=1 Tax=Colwellia psychrerythraea TaxID=28229 RepID=A0A099KL95_COLPS|nr:hypothetical protein [Colwellia psychrerythraea]KGJ90398.1 hypothetical protein GAB14E_3641 [Colwellia psychrerythraea]
MKMISILLMCFFILSCSSTKVHLYTRYLSAEEADAVTKNLEQLGFDVIANTLVFPDGIEQSTLLYSPFVEGENSLNILIDTLADIGWVMPNVQPIFAGNHYYTKNSVGLLLLPDGGRQSDKVIRQDLANEYKSKACDSAIKLRLNNDASYQFLYPNKTDSQMEQLTGTWQITSYPYIELTSLNKVWRFYYEIQKSAITDVVGKVEVIELKPLDDHYTLPKCSFFYGLRA